MHACSVQVMSRDVHDFFQTQQKEISMKMLMLVMFKSKKYVNIRDLNCHCTVNLFFPIYPNHLEETFDILKKII